MRMYVCFTLVVDCLTASFVEAVCAVCLSVCVVRWVYAMAGAPGPGVGAAAPGVFDRAPVESSSNGAPTTTTTTAVRKNFPETWIWTDQTIG